MTHGQAAPTHGRDDGARLPAAGYAFVVAAAGVAVLAGLVLAFVPMSTTVSESARVTPAPDPTDAEASPEAEAQTGRQATHETLAESEGWATLAIVAGPLLVLAGVPLLARRRGPALAIRGVSGLLLLASTVLGALSFGIFYLPVAALMLVAAGLALTTPWSWPHRVTTGLAGLLLAALLATSVSISWAVAAVTLPAAGFFVAAAIRAVIPAR